jgi:D-alanyl-D-alanine carboxypeptidase
MSLDTTVTVSKHAAAQPPSRLGLKPGQKIAMRYLIRAAAIKSANDAAMPPSASISARRSQAAFAKRMTKTARALGMNKHHLQEPQWPDRRGPSVDRPRHERARPASVLRFPAILRHLRAPHGRRRHGDQVTQHQLALSGCLRRRRRDQDRLHRRRRVQPDRLGQARHKHIIATIFGGPSTAEPQRQDGRTDGPGLFEKAKKRTRHRNARRAAPLPPESADWSAEAAPAAIDEPKVEGRLGQDHPRDRVVTHSLRPRPRPGLSEPQPEVPAAWLWPWPKASIRRAGRSNCRPRRPKARWSSRRWRWPRSSSTADTAGREP